MLNPECLNSKDVLAHLHSLGFHDISPQQIKEFLHDLKKLIKYEQKQMQNCVNIESEDVHSFECECSDPEPENMPEKLLNNESYCGSSVSSNSTSTTFSQSNSRFDGLNKHSARSTADSELPLTAHTAFIRPWNLQVSINKGKKNHDPVRLYHQYKKFWESQSFPGESKHSELRWIIRNRMLGQEPNPKIFVTHQKCS